MRTRSKLLAAATVAAMLLAMILSGDRQRPAATERPTTPTERSRAGTLPKAFLERARPPSALSDDRRPVLPSSSEVDVRRSAELEAKGVTPHKLYASRAGGRMVLAAIHARRYGEPVLADTTEALGDELWANAEPGRADRDVIALLPQQAELMAKLKDLARRHPEDPFFITLIAQIDDDLSDTQRGEPRGVEGKLEGEDDEAPRHKEEDDGEAEDRAGSGSDREGSRPG